MKGTLYRRLRREVDRWSTSSFFVGVLIIVPLLVVLIGVVQSGEKWEHISSTVLPTYIYNTLILAVSVCVLSVLFAVLPAWLVSTCNFPGRGIFEWALVLPLAIPTYVAAFVYIEIPEMAIPWLVEIRLNHGVDAFIWAEKILRYGLLALFMAGVLFPYLYITVRACFSQQRRGLIEASLMMGNSSTGTFFRVALPLARPAIAGGLALILMEVINDYGAVNFFGVPTMTEGIFRTWFGLQDRASAVRIAGMAMAAILFVIVLERSVRGGARYSEIRPSTNRFSRRRLGVLGSLAAMLVCLIPLVIGLIYPVYKLSGWAWLTAPKVLSSGFVGELWRSVALALIAAFILTAVALLFAYSVRLHPTRWLRLANRIFTVGYAAPGAVIAIGVMVTFGAVDAWIGTAFVSGTVFAIGFAYLVRFIAVAYHPISAGFAQICGNMDESSRNLGKGPGTTLLRINVPLMKGTLLGAAMLIFVDILKELPLTMILRPSGFETLSTKAFGLAKEGRIQESAVPSLLIIIASAVALAILNRYMRNRKVSA